MRRTFYIVVCALLMSGCQRLENPDVNLQTTLFRSDWTNGQRAKVSANLVALLKRGMTKEEVTSILEYPSRPNDCIKKNSDREEWTFTITLGRILILKFDGNKLISIDGG